MHKREELLSSLETASHIVRNNGDVASDYFFSAESFANEIDRLIELIQKSHLGPIAWLKALYCRKKAKYTWCAPTFDLDDYLTGHPSAEFLGNSIYKLL